jgi:hypothetical protein
MGCDRPRLLERLCRGDSRGSPLHKTRFPSLPKTRRGNPSSKPSLLRLRDAVIHAEANHRAPGSEGVPALEHRHTSIPPQIHDRGRDALAPENPSPPGESPKVVIARSETTKQSIRSLPDAPKQLIFRMDCRGLSALAMMVWWDLLGADAFLTIPCRTRLFYLRGVSFDPFRVRAGVLLGSARLSTMKRLNPFESGPGFLPLPGEQYGYAALSQSPRFGDRCVRSKHATGGSMRVKHIRGKHCQKFLNRPLSRQTTLFFPSQGHIRRVHVPRRVTSTVMVVATTPEDEREL